MYIIFSLFLHYRLKYSRVVSRTTEDPLQITIMFFSIDTSIDPDKRPDEDLQSKVTLNLSLEIDRPVTQRVEIEYKRHRRTTNIQRGTLPMFFLFNNVVVISYLIRDT